MHRDAVPTKNEFPRAKRTIGFLPARKHVRDGTVDNPIQLWKAAAQKDAQVDALRIIVKLVAIDGHPRAAGKRHWQAVCVKQILHVVGDAAFDGGMATRTSCELLDFCERLEDKASMEMVDEIAFAVERVVPRTIRVLRSEHEIQISFRRLPIPRI